MNGTSVIECEALLELLQESRGHVAALHQEERFSELLAECVLHFNSYRTYIVAGMPGGPYGGVSRDEATDELTNLRPGSAWATKRTPVSASAPVAGRSPWSASRIAHRSFRSRP